MKRALVLTVALFVALSMATVAGQFSGDWFSMFRIGGDPLDFTFFFTDITLTYSVGDWSFTSFSEFGDFGGADVGYMDQFFTVGGTLGAFQFGSYLQFDPVAVEFAKWVSGASVSIAGVNLYGFMALEAGETLNGTGWLIGGSGVAGDVSITAEAYFNLANSLLGAFWGPWTPADIFGGWTSYAASACDGTYIVDDAFSVVAWDCAPAWTGIDISLGMPFACLDVVVDLAFTCLDGFDYIKFQLNDIDLGYGWITLDDFDIKFTTQTKSVSVDLDIHLGGTCVTPYWEFTKASGAAWEITGFKMYALALDYSWNGVSFKSITLLDTAGYVLTTGGGVYPAAYDPYFCTVAYDELFQITVDGDSCCGGGFSFKVQNWFDIEGSDQLFDWKAIWASGSVDIGSNFTLGGGLRISDAGVERVDLWVDFYF
jgi:hypothetical protein